jgi:SAM-dependent methyltransferase
MVLGMSDFSSARYWERRYALGGHSGAGSYGRLARFKAGFLNGFMAANGVTDVLDLGCGDGHLLSLLHPPTYTGVDVSRGVLGRLTARFPGHRFVHFDDMAGEPAADLTLSIDVIFHLIEDDVFHAYLRALFTKARRFVVIYASNVDLPWSASHVRHRRFSDTVARDFPDFALTAHIPNRYAFDPARPDQTSFADFFVYARLGATVALVECEDYTAAA